VNAVVLALPVDQPGVAVADRHAIGVRLALVVALAIDAGETARLVALAAGLAGREAPPTRGQLPGDEHAVVADFATVKLVAATHLVALTIRVAAAGVATLVLDAALTRLAVAVRAGLAVVSGAIVAGAACADSNQSRQNQQERAKGAA
jgi:hypothetical protein